MSGPSSEQLQLESEQMQFYQEGISHAQTTFGEQQALLKQMQAVYSPILAKGPSQEGFSATEKAALDAQVKEGTATNYGRAARAVGEHIASEGGGDNPLPSAATEAMKGEVATSAAGEESREESQILSEDYSQGFKQWEAAGSGLAEASGQLNPVAYEQAATGAGSAAEKTASDIVSEENSWMAPVFGAIGEIGGAVMTGGMSNLGKGAGFFGGNS